jgi:hypothetical protein
MRTAAAVLAGFVVWSVIWLVGNVVLSGTGLTSRDVSVPVESMVALGLLLVLSVICSFVAGLTARAIDRENARGAGMILALLLLVVGVVTQWNVGMLMPMWYHALFLGLLVPVTLFAAGWWRTPPDPGI